MQPIETNTSEDEEQLALLYLPLGQPGSGMTRYGAAMHFFKLGKLDADLLEAYRICCNLDSEDPQAVAVSRRSPGSSD